jgi:hypothetical protein
LSASSWTTAKVPAACTLCSEPALRQNIVLAPLQPSTVISLPETLLRLRPLLSAFFIFSPSSGCTSCGLFHWSWSRFDVSLTLAPLLLFSDWTSSITVSFPCYLNMLANPLTIIDQGVVYTPSRQASSWASTRIRHTSSQQVSSWAGTRIRNTSSRHITFAKSFLLGEHKDSIRHTSSRQVSSWAGTRTLHKSSRHRCSHTISILSHHHHHHHHHLADSHHHLDALHKPSTQSYIVPVR